MNADSPNIPLQQFPGGEEAVEYKWTFALWLIMFLLVICLTLINYFGLMVHRAM